jgi:hypothetical protein
MRVRLTCLLSTLLLVPSLVYADGHKAGLSGGGGGGNGASKLFGFHLGFDHKLPGDAKTLADYNYWRWSLVLADLSVQFGSHDGQATQVTYMAGARYELTPRFSQNKVAARALLGVANTNHLNHGAKNDFVYAFGGVYEWFRKRTAEEIKNDDPQLGLGFHVQVDVIIRDNDELDLGTFTRVSAGVVYRFRRHHQ